jgi:ankyrin repeat protein
VPQWHADWLRPTAALRRARCVVVVVLLLLLLLCAQSGYTPLHDAAENGNTSVVQLLLERGANKEAKTNVVRTRHAHACAPRCCAWPRAQHKARGAAAAAAAAAAVRRARARARAAAFAACSVFFARKLRCHACLRARHCRRGRRAAPRRVRM